MKKILLALTVLLLLVSGCAKNQRTLKVFNWGAYIDESVIADFEKKYDVKVVYDNYDSNESMYTKIQSGESYDILVPSDHMVERLIAEGKLQKLDKSKITVLTTIEPSLLNRPFDVGNAYSVPYFWGSVGIVYNNEKVSLSDLETEGWKILDNPKYKGRIFIYDSVRDVFMIAYKALGFSANSNKPEEIDAAFKLLQEINATTQPVYVSEDGIDNMVSAQKDIAVMFSGDAAYIKTQNPKMDFFAPAEGTNIWIDSMVIPVESKNADLAYDWINYMLEPEVAMKNTLFVGYTSPVISVFDAVTAKGGAYYGIAAYTPRLDNPLDEVYRYDEQLKIQLAELWIKVKAQ